MAVQLGAYQSLRAGLSTIYITDMFVDGTVIYTQTVLYPIKSGNVLSISANQRIDYRGMEAVLLAGGYKKVY